LNNLIPLSWLALTFNSFKLKCKDKFLWCYFITFFFFTILIINKMCVIFFEMYFVQLNWRKMTFKLTKLKSLILKCDYMSKGYLKSEWPPKFHSSHNCFIILTEKEINLLLCDSVWGLLIHITNYRSIVNGLYPGVDFIRQLTTCAWNLRFVPILLAQIYSNLVSCICTLFKTF
jgi:hypothetical protein